MKVVARSYYDAVGVSAPGLVCEDASLAVQAAREEVDINNIVKKYMRTGELPTTRQGAYADMTNMVDLAGALEMVDAAEEAFMALPAEVRRYFNNDPVELVAFAQDRNNLPKAIELGLAVPPQPVLQASNKEPGAAPAAPVTGV